MKPQPPPPPSSSSSSSSRLLLRRPPSPLPMPTHPTYSGPEQFASSSSSHLLASLRSSSNRAGPSRTGPYLGVGDDAPPTAGTSTTTTTRKRKLAQQAKEEVEEVELLNEAASSSSSTTKGRLSAKAKGKGKERALPSASAASSSSSSSGRRRRVIPAPLPGEESEEEEGVEDKERLSDYNCPVCLCPPVQATLTPCGHLMCHLCLTTSLATTSIRTFIPPPPPPLWKPFPFSNPTTVNPSLLRQIPPKRYAPTDLNIEGICPVCREVLPGGLTGKGRRTGAGARGGRRGRGGFGMGGRWKEGEGKGEGVRRLEMRVVDC